MILSREIIAVFCPRFVEKEVEIQNVKPDGTPGNHWAVKFQ
jgi:hypothetical protein